MTRSYRTYWPVMGCALLAIACGRGTSTSDVGVGDPDPPAVMDPPEVVVTDDPVDETPMEPVMEMPAPTPTEVIEETPLLPSRIELLVRPSRAFYRTGQTIEVEAAAFDDNDLQVFEVELDVEVEPATAVVQQPDGSYLLDSEGAVTFRACAVEDRERCEQTTLLVDGDAPSIEISAPLPGEELSDDVITVQGSVADTRTQAELFVNGVAVPVDDLGQFSTEITPVWGINHIQAVASDGVVDSSRAELDVMWADNFRDYLEGAADPSVIAASLPEAVTLQLGSRLFDDGRPLDTDAQQLRTEDLADIVELVIANVDLASALPDPLVDAAPTLSLRVTDVISSDATVSMGLLDGGAELFIRLDDVHASTEGGLSLEGSNVDLSGGIGLSLVALATLTMDKADPDAPIEVELTELVTAIESAEGRFDSEEANAVFRLAEGTLRSALENELEGAFRDTLAGALPDVLGGALGAIDTALRDQAITLDTGIFPTLELQIDGRVRELDTRYARWLRAGMQATVGNDQTTLHPTSRGVARHAATGGDPLFESDPLQLAIRLELLNTLLHTLWNGGLLEIDATPLLPEDVAGTFDRAELSGELPPVLQRAGADEGHDLWLAVGQLELVLELQGVATRYGIGLGAGVSLDVTDNALNLMVDETPDIRAWVISSDAETPPLDGDVLKALIETLLWPELTTALAGGLSIELPSLSPGNLSGIAPGLGSLTLELESRGRPEIRGQSLVVDLSLLGSLAP